MRIPLLAAVLALCACALDGEDVQVIAHRGASHDAPEHTFAAWDLAIERGTDWIELDLQMTRDGALVILHDDSLDRTARGPAADCRGLVREHRLDQLERCDVGRWFNEAHPDRARAEFVGARIPTLDAVLERYDGRARFYIETKNPAEAPGMEEALLASLARHGLLTGRGASQRVLLQSFSAASLQRLHELAPALRLVLLVEDAIPADSLDVFLERVAGYAKGIGPSRALVNRRLVERAHVAGLFVHPYTVNELPSMSFLLGLGVDGMFTDRPDLLRGLLGP